MISMRNIGLALITGGTTMALVACAGTTAGTVSAEDSFLGTWSLISMVKGGQTTSEEDIAAMQSLGLDVLLEFKDDGTFVLNLFGETISGTWEAIDETTAKATAEGEGIDITLSDGLLTFSQPGGDTSMTFERAGSTAKAETKDDADATADEAAGDAATTEDAGAEAATDGTEAAK